MIVVIHELGFASEVGHSVLFRDGGVVVEPGTPAPRHRQPAASPHP
jgi:ABC-type histidine transport system ATPase subunit